MIPQTENGSFKCILNAQILLINKLLELLCKKLGSRHEAMILIAFTTVTRTKRNGLRILNFMKTLPNWVLKVSEQKASESMNSIDVFKLDSDSCYCYHNMRKS